VRRHSAALSRPTKIAAADLGHNFSGVNVPFSRIIDFAARHQLPAVYWDGRFVKDAGLISLAHSLDEEGRQGATYVDRILNAKSRVTSPSNRRESSSW
jgi:hypothetical protein